MDFLTTEQIGQTRELTQEGFLLCRATPIARIGVMQYLPNEVPVEAGPDGIVRISRNEDEVFNPESMASLNGKSLTILHPDEDVNPSNWKELTVGTVFNARRGEGMDSDLLVADLLITDADAIEAAEPSTQLSAGYEADYVTTAAGEGYQSNIRYNHLALLPNQLGRCGSRCAIGDKQTISGDQPVKAKTSFMDKIRAAFKSQDADELEKALKSEDEEMPEDKPVDEPTQPEEKTEDEAEEPTLADLCKRIEALEEAMKATKDEEPEEKPEEKKEESTSDDDEEEDEDESDEEMTEDKRKAKSKDTDSLRNDFQEIAARAEILSPGIKIPTFDANADAKKTMDSLCALKRKALANAFDNSKVRDSIQPLVGTSPSLKTMDCKTLQATFVGASEIVKRENMNARTSTARDHQGPQTVESQIAAINAANAKFWGRN